MAREFEAPVGTIKRRLFVARQRLKDVLVEAGFGADDTGFGEPNEEVPRRSKKRELVTA